MTAERREELLGELWVAEQGRDLARLTAVFPHPHYELIGNSRVYDGTAEVARWLRDRGAAFPDYRYDPLHFFHADDAVTAEVWVSGTHLGRIEGLEGFEPSGKRFRCRMAALYLFGDDTLRSARLYFDHATIARQLA